MLENNEKKHFIIILDIGLEKIQILFIVTERKTCCVTHDAWQNFDLGFEG